MKASYEMDKTLMDKDTLHEVELHIFQDIIDFERYAGSAFLQDDKEMMNIFKGQHIGLMRLQKWLSEKYLRVCQKEDEEKEGKQVRIHTTIPIGNIGDELIFVKMIEFFKTHRFSLEELRKFMDAVPEECDEGLVEKSYAAYVKEQMATLKDHDHKLFAQIVNGLVAEGWKEDGGSHVFRLLSKDGFAIKVFRHAESPQVIKICFSAEPEEEDEND